MGRVDIYACILIYSSCDFDLSLCSHHIEFPPYMAICTVFTKSSLNHEHHYEKFFLALLVRQIRMHRYIIVLHCFYVSETPIKCVVEPNFQVMW